MKVNTVLATQEASRACKPHVQCLQRFGQTMPAPVQQNNKENETHYATPCPSEKYSYVGPGLVPGL